jgi:hypothetical protein
MMQGFNILLDLAGSTFNVKWLTGIRSDTYIDQACMIIGDILQEGGQ